MDIYKRYKQLEEENYKLEQKVYHLEQECAKNPGALDRVESKMVEEFGEEEDIMKKQSDLIEKLKEDDFKHFKDAFRYAFSIGHISEDEPYMYMGFDAESNTVYFKHGITRQYKNLQLTEEE